MGDRKSAGAYETVIVETVQSICTVTMNRPQAYNACSNQLTADLAAAMENADRDETVKVIILTGAGKAFNAGQDLAELKQRYDGGETPNLGIDLRERYNPIIRRMCRMDKAIIAAVNGVAAGAGCSLALACDFRIASEQAVFIEAFIHVGVAPDAGSTYFLPRMIGHARAMEMCCTGRKVDAPEALRMGLVNLVVEADRLMDEARALAEDLAARPARALAWTKQLLRQSFSHSLDQQLEAEAAIQEVASRTADHLEAVNAFVEKRPPRFTGR
ncbi:MAG: enoyl-CoA hydratase/isomerase family protein [Phycisphaerales bacterium]|nr:MAG: enoyl-CoA hydratase/isomerase family protein [Phycisphaerales bacterium]